MIDTCSGEERLASQLENAGTQMVKLMAHTGFNRRRYEALLLDTVCMEVDIDGTRTTFASSPQLYDFVIGAASGPEQIELYQLYMSESGRRFVWSLSNMLLVCSLFPIKLKQLKDLPRNPYASKAPAKQTEAYTNEKL